jgi:hypothetical protein
MGEHYGVEVRGEIRPARRMHNTVLHELARAELAAVRVSGAGRALSAERAAVRRFSQALGLR